MINHGNKTPWYRMTIAYFLGKKCTISHMRMTQIASQQIVDPHKQGLCG